MPNSVKQCLYLTIQGAVQGVGFRPFVYRLAKEIGLGGWVNNSNAGVFIEVEGTKQQLERFLWRLKTENPPRSQIQNIEIDWRKLKGFKTFEILPSTAGKKTAIVLPDLATCPDCLQEIFDLTNRRYRYPFTNCTNCGPRYSIIEA
ncbi:MAG: acylphosphatase, partial [Waterburya sp.]